MRFQVPEGATPIEDASGLIPQGLATYGDLCAAEAENILKAARIHLKRRKNPARAWMTEDYIRKVHRAMFDEVWEWAGRYRGSELTIGIPAYRIREEIAKLCQDAAYWDRQTESPIPVLERAVRVHHRLSWIHPFPNGNGRHARLIADIYLRAHRHPLPNWPRTEMSDPGTQRSEYIRALKEADNGSFGPLMDFTTLYLKS